MDAYNYNSSMNSHDGNQDANAIITPEELRAMTPPQLFQYFHNDIKREMGSTFERWNNLMLDSPGVPAEAATVILVSTRDRFRRMQIDVEGIRILYSGSGPDGLDLMEKVNRLSRGLLGDAQLVQAVIDELGEWPNGELVTRQRELYRAELAAERAEREAIFEREQRAALERAQSRARERARQNHRMRLDRRNEQNRQRRIARNMAMAEAEIEAQARAQHQQLHHHHYQQVQSSPQAQAAIGRRRTSRRGVNRRLHADMA